MNQACSACPGTNPDGDVGASKALLCHKMLVAAKEGKEDGGWSNVIGRKQEDLRRLLELGLPVDRRSEVI